MTEGTRAGFNRDFWIAGGVMGMVDGNVTELLPGVASADPEAARAEVNRLLPPMRTLSWWLLEKGTEIP